MENVIEKINKAAIRFLAPLTPEETYTAVVEEAVKLIGAEFGTILLEQEGEITRVYASWDELYKITPHKRANTYKTFIEKKSRLIEVTDLSNDHSYKQLKDLGVKAMLYIPLTNRHESIGVLIVNARYPLTASKEQLETLNLFGSLASMAIRKTQLYSEVKKALETRDLFISMAAHELRTPLTAINGYVQLLHSKLASQDTTIGRWSQQLLWETTRLTNLINELLEISRIRSGELSYTWKECTLTELINRALSQFKFVYPERTITFQNQLSTNSNTVIGDFDKLIQLFVNVFDNAAKYSPSEKDVMVTLSAKASYFIVTVQDQGKGIDKKELPKIFEGFYKGQNNKVEGMGLGLYLVKNIIQRHRGSIDIHSRVNKGTTVEIKLPKAKHSTLANTSPTL